MTHFIVLSPHFDDAALSVGGLIAQNPHVTTVVTFFAGPPVHSRQTDWDRRSGFGSSDEAVVARPKEDAQAFHTIGAATRQFAYPDGQYRDDREPAAEEIIVHNVKADIERLLHEFREVPLQIYGPMAHWPGITHGDHRILHDALMQVAMGSKFSRVEFYLYEDLPYAHVYGWGGIRKLLPFRSGVARIRVRRAIRKVARMAGVGLEPVTVSIAPSQLEEKVRMVEAYASQVRAFRTFGDDLVTLVRQFAHRRLRYRQQHAAEVVHRLIIEDTSRIAAASG